MKSPNLLSRNVLIYLSSLISLSSSAPIQSEYDLPFVEHQSTSSSSETITTIEQQNSSAHINPFAPRPISYVFDSKLLSPYMRLHKLSPTSNNITCNDGSQAGYYIRQNVHSKSWIIYLQGGGFCGSDESCQLRWQRNPNLMSSHYWPKTKSVDGILSSEPNDNPYLWNANHVYVPYCSSDSWTGLMPASQNHNNKHSPRTQTHGLDSTSSPSFAFMGSKIIERVLDSLYEDLPLASSLQQAKFILLAGDSAGATGVILNLDKVKKYVENKFEKRKTDCQSADLKQICNTAKQPPVLRGLADSGWFLDNEPYYQQSSNGDGMLNDQQLGGPPTFGPEDCDKQTCNPLQSIKHAMRHWNGQVPQACALEYPAEPWRCYFGYRAYPSLKTPLFVVQWLYDEAQLLVDNIARPDTTDQWDYVHKVASEMRASLENVTALFAPSCFSHSLVTKSNWNQININGLKLPHVLNTWEEQSLLDMAPEISSFPDEFTTNTGLMVTMQDGERHTAHQNNISSISTMNQPTFETLMLEQDITSNSNAPSQHLSARDSNEFQHPPLIETRSASRQPLTQTSNKARGRKRKRNNQQPRSKQTRQATSSGLQRPINIPVVATQRDYNDVQSYPIVNPLQNLLPLIDRSLANGNILFERQSRSDKLALGNSNGRLGRSTIVDDSTLMLGNSMPEDTSHTHEPAKVDYNPSFDLRSHILASFGGDGGAAITTTNRGHEFNRFRLIDTCSWPQCNRDCPALNIDFNIGSIVQF